MNKVTRTKLIKEFVFDRGGTGDVPGDVEQAAGEMADLLERAEYFVEQSTKHPAPSIRMKALKLREDIKKFQEKDSV